MATQTLSIAGGDKMRAKLNQLAQHLGRGGVVNVGLLAGATYPAKAREMLASKKRLTKRQRVQLPKIAASAGAPSVPQVAFWNEFGTTTQPPRPFFRRMIAAKSPRWPQALGAAAKHEKFSATKTLAAMGSLIQGQLRQSINEFTSPP